MSDLISLGDVGHMVTNSTIEVAALVSGAYAAYVTFKHKLLDVNKADVQISKYETERELFALMSDNMKTLQEEIKTLKKETADLIKQLHMSESETRVYERLCEDYEFELKQARALNSILTHALGQFEAELQKIVEGCE